MPIQDGSRRGRDALCALSDSSSTLSVHTPIADSPCTGCEQRRPSDVRILTTICLRRLDSNVRGVVRDSRAQFVRAACKETSPGLGP